MITTEINHCNNIEYAKINIRKNILNIKYAMNGTGKSTIAKAIELASENQSLERLKPFGNTAEPRCSIDNPINNVLVFNEEFVNTLVFKESEVIENAFDIFIKTKDYEDKQNAINIKLADIHIDTSKDQDLNTLLSVGKFVLEKFTIKNDKKSFKQNGLIKNLTNSKSIFTLPEPIKQFQPLMEQECNVEWVTWKNDGSRFDEKKICPFCSKALSENYEDEKKIFTESYTKSNVKGIKDMLSRIDSVKEYMDESEYQLLYNCISKTQDKAEINVMIMKFYTELEYLVQKINDVTGFNSYKVEREDLSKLEDKLSTLVISSTPLQMFNNEKTIKIINEINTKIQELIKETESLKKDIGIFKGIVKSRINNAVNDINDFLDIAQINYKLEIKQESEHDAQTRLKYKCGVENEVKVDNIEKHLSWGERNAFALVLFMHYALSKQPELIILDDPISSFDSNKKYAIINRLFLNNEHKESFYQKTVMMLTHDFEPIIDFIINQKPNGGSANAAFLKNTDGTLSEIKITKDDVKSLPILLAENAKDETLNKVHRIICLRKLLEHTLRNSGKELAYNLLSCLLKGYDCPKYTDDTKITPADIELGEKSIANYLADFSYSNYQNDTFNKTDIVDLYKNEPNNYFKLQIFRVLIEIAQLRSKIKGNQPLLKYIDEQFHIENDYIYYLNLNKFDVVPDLIIPKCNEFLQNEGVI